MVTKKIFCTNTLKDTFGCSITVNYLITESHDILNDQICNYGIAIEKHPDTDKSDVYNANCCFRHKQNAEILLKELYKYSVTPVLAEESIDIILDKCKFVY